MSDSNVNKSDDEQTSEDREISEILSKPMKPKFDARTEFQMKKKATQSKVSPSRVDSRKDSRTFQSSSYQDFNKKGFKAKSIGADSSSSRSFATHVADQSPKRTVPERTAKNKTSPSVQNTKESSFFDSIINRSRLLWRDICDLEPRLTRETGAFKQLSPVKSSEYKKNSMSSFKIHKNTLVGTGVSTEPSHQSQVEELSETSFRSFLKLKDYSSRNTSSGRTSQETGSDSNPKLIQHSPPSTIENLSQLTLRDSGKLEGSPAASDSSSRITGATFSDSAEPCFAPSIGKIKALDSFTNKSFTQFNQKALELKQKVTLYFKEIECMVRKCPVQTKAHVFKKYENINLELTELQTICLNYKSKIEAGHLKILASQSSSTLKDDKTENSEYVSNLHRKYALAESYISLMKKFQEINESVHMFLSKFVNWD